MEKNVGLKDLSNPETFLNHLDNLLKFERVNPSESKETKAAANPFPLEVFPEPIQEIITATNKTLKYPIDFTAAGILFAASIAIGNTFQAQVKKGWTENAVIYLALVGRSGTNKSHPLSFALAPIMEKDDQNFYEYSKEKAFFDQLLNTQASQQQEKQRTKPILKKILVSDTTPEALANIHNFNKRGIGVYADELAGWFKSFNRYHKGSEQEFWLSNWSGKPVIIDRKTSESIRISKPFISVCGTIQTSILDEMAKDNRSQNGFIDRILTVIPDNLKNETWTDNELDKVYFDNWQAIIENLLFEKLNLSEIGKPEPQTLIFSPEAKAMLYDWQKRNAEISNRQQNEMIAGLFSKLQIYSIRFSLILQMLYYACGNENKQTIQSKAVKGALKLTEYFKQTAIKVHGLINEGSPLDKLPENKQKFYDALPDILTTNEAIEQGTKFDISKRSVKRFLNEKKLFNRLMQGKYEKTL